jgi:hypothetical protein
MLNESLLNRMQLATLSQALHGRDFFPALHHGQHQAGVPALAIHQHGAGAALPVIAPLLCSSKLQMLAQQIEDRHTRVNIELVLLFVDGQRETYCAAGPLPRLRLRLGWESSNYAACHAYADKIAPAEFAASLGMFVTRFHEPSDAVVRHPPCPIVTIT